ncbi:MAG: MlaD family protein [Pseudomonadota bacterium]
MPVEVNRYERIAGLFVVVAILVVVFVSVGLIVRTGYFSEKSSYHVMVPSAGGLNNGTHVQMSGLNVGWVEKITLIAPRQVRVDFSVLIKYQRQMVEGTVVQMVRPYALGEKMLDIRPGEPGNPVLSAGAEVPLLDSVDLVDLLSGRKLGPFVASLEKLMTDLNQTVEFMREAGTLERVNQLLDSSGPMIGNVNDMAREMALSAGTMNREQRLERLTEEMRLASEQMNHLLPEMREQMPGTLAQMNRLIGNMNQLSEDLSELTPALAELAPQMPETGRRTIEAIDEAVILMKAMQKSFLLRGKVEDVVEEEEEAERESRRRQSGGALPAIDISE